MTESSTTRRNVLLGVAATGLAVPVLAACGSATNGSSGDTTGDPAGTSSDPTTIKISDIPVGGGRIYPDQQLVVTQPKAGDFKAFSAVCTHQGCIVDDVSNGFIACPCHGSRFAIATGKPTADSFAKAPLPSKKVSETGTNLTVS